MNQIVKIKKGDIKRQIPGLFSIDKGWYDISKEGQNIKYLYYPGDNIRSSSIYQKYKKSIDENLKKIIQIIKTKLDLLEEKETVKKQELEKDKLNFDFNPLKLKTYNISTIFKGESFSEGGSEYRKDGSIIFSKENDAYRHIVNMTLFLGNEEAAAILEQQVLVIPNYMNDTTTASWSAYDYFFEKSNIIDPLLSSTLVILGTVHTHPSGGGPSTWVYDGYGDLDFAAYSTPYKPVYVFQIGQNQVSLIAAHPKARENEKYLEYNITLRSASHINLTDLSNGNSSLRKYTKQTTSTIKHALQK